MLKACQTQLHGMSTISTAIHFVNMGSKHWNNNFELLLLDWFHHWFCVWQLSITPQWQSTVTTWWRNSRKAFRMCFWRDSPRTFLPWCCVLFLKCCLNVSCFVLEKCGYRQAMPHRDHCNTFYIRIRWMLRNEMVLVHLSLIFKTFSVLLACCKIRTGNLKKNETYVVMPVNYLDFYYSEVKKGQKLHFIVCVCWGCVCWGCVWNDIHDDVTS